MSNEDIKKVLVQYKRVSNMIRHIEDEIAQIDDKVLGIRENQMTGMPKGSSSETGNRTGLHRYGAFSKT